MLKLELKGQFLEEFLEKKATGIKFEDPWVHQDHKARWYSIEQKKMDTVYNMC